ncbi:MAG: hypothetical protein EOO19_00640 [Chryseobacterium sp.]|nr:MAG: hypothetical protein EOO19_00640 [Chryseobacterium sp.]
MVSNKLIKNILSLGVVQMVNFIFPLITIPYISRIIGPQGYGIINYVTAFVAYFALLIGYGFDMTATRRISQNSYNAKEINTIVSEIYWSRLFLFCISCVIFLICLFTVKTISSDKLIAIVLMVGCLSNVISPQFLYQGKQELTIFSKINFTKGVINLVLIFILITHLV